MTINKAQVKDSSRWSEWHSTCHLDVRRDLNVKLQSNLRYVHSHVKKIILASYFSKVTIFDSLCVTALDDIFSNEQTTCPRS